MFFANQIIALSSAEPKKFRQEVRRRINAVKGNGLLPANSAELFDELAPRLVDRESIDFFASKIRGAMCLRLDDSVTDSVRRMRDTDQDKLLQLFQYANLPYPVTWIEAGDRNVVGLLLQQEEQEGPITVHTAVHGAGGLPAVRKDLFITISDEGITSSTDGTDFQRSFSEQHGKMTNVQMDAYRIAILLNSRSHVFRIGEVEKDKKQDEKRLRKKFGAASYVSLRPIEFDLDRIFKKNPDISAENARKLAAESLVRGHFKVRKTGVFWWSPHVRNPSGTEVEDLLSHKDRTVLESDPYDGDGPIF